MNNWSTIAPVGLLIVNLAACSSQPGAAKGDGGPNQGDSAVDRHDEGVEEVSGQSEAGAGDTLPNEGGSSDGSSYQVCPESGGSCPNSCLRIVGQWLNPATGCFTGADITGCINAAGMLVSATGWCFVYVPTGAVVLTNYDIPPLGDPAFPGDWQRCTSAQYFAATADSTSAACSRDAGGAEGGSDGAVEHDGAGDTGVD